MTAKPARGLSWTTRSPLLFARGADLLAGALVLDEEAAQRGLVEGAHFRHYQGVQMIGSGPDDLG